MSMNAVYALNGILDHFRGKGISLLFILAAVPCIVTAASGGSFYVAVDGRPDNDGSAARPWPSIEHALSRVGAGNTIIVKPGLYRGAVQIRNHPARPEGPPTVIRSEVKWKAVINGGESEAINIVDCPGIVIDGFEICGARADGVSMNTDGGTLRNCWVHHNGAMGVSSHNHKNVTIEANLIEFNGGNIQYHHGVYVDGEHPAIRRNIIRHNSGYGLHLYPSIKDAVVSQNLVHGHAHQAGIIVACPEGGGRNLIANNTVADNARCIEIWRGDGEKVFNNILAGPGQALAFSHNTKNVAADHNLCRRDPAHQGPHSMVADPQFVDPSRGLYWLQAGSPAIGRGTPDQARPTDFWGRPTRRGPAPDLGAFAFVPSLADPQKRIGWYGYPYRFHPKGDMELPDLWALPE